MTVGELEERINQVLNDPQQMEELSRLAQSLMGGGGGAEQAASELGLDAGLLAKAAKLLREDSGDGSDSQGLLRAIEPWLKPRRREKLERAMKLARLSHLAKLALGEGWGDV